MFKTNKVIRSISLTLVFAIVCTLLSFYPPTFVDASTELLLSAGKAMSASSGSTAALANDGDGDTYWDGIISDKINDVGTNTPPCAWLQTDLGISYNLSRIVVKPYYLDARHYNYNVYASLDGNTWIQVGTNDGEEAATAEGDTYYVNNVLARYVRVSVYKNSVEGNYSAHIRELEVYGTEISDADIVAADKQALQIGLSENDTLDNVKNNVVLPAIGENGCSIIWQSSMPEIISADGVVNRPQDTDKTVVMTATITNGNYNDTKSFTIVVKQMVPGESEIELLSQGKPTTASYSSYPELHGPDKVNDGIINGDIINGVPAENYWDSIRGAGGLAWVRIDLMSTFTLTSINVAPYYDGSRYYNYFVEISEDGENWVKVGEKTDTVPSPRLGDTYSFEQKTLGRYVRVSVTKNSVDNYSVHLSEIKVYGYKDDADAVAEDKAALEIGYSSGDDASNVNKDVILPKTLNCGSSISWTSTDPSIINSDGVVTRPYDEDKAVTLTATIKKGLITDTKEFTLIVKYRVPISVGKPVTASSTEAGSNAANAVDGDDSTYWAGYIDGVTKVATLTVDLNEAYDLTNINVRPYNDGSRYYNYYVEVSADGSIWNEVCRNDSAVPASAIGDSFSINAKGRYVRLNITKYYTGSGFDYLAHIREIKVYGNITDENSVAEDKKSLELGYAQGDSANSVRMNITLPVKGVNGSNITWSSSDTNIIDLNGRLNTSAFTGDAAQVALTAEISKDGVSETKQFEITVIKPISQGRPTITNSAVSGHGPELVNDGNPYTYLDSFRGNDGASLWQVDLQGNYNLDGINIVNFADGTRFYKYYAKISTDGKNWTPVLSKNNEGLSTSAGDFYDVKGTARYVRIYTTHNSVSEDSIHICEVRVFGKEAGNNSVLPAEINNASTDKSSYKVGDAAKINMSVNNKSNETAKIRSIKIKVSGLADPMYFSENTIAENVSIEAGQSYVIENKDFWNIAQNKNIIGSYGLWISIELEDGRAIDKYCGFIRVIDDKTLLNYDVKKFDYNGLNVYALDGGMSAEACVEKSLESLDSTVSHSWYIQSNGGPDFVYASENFLKDSIQKTVDLYNQNLGADTQFDTVILATGNCGVNYLSTITKAPVLPVQFLVTADTYKELRDVVDAANEAGIPCYSTLGHDLSMKKGVAWVKLLDLPQEYKDFLSRHNVKNVILAATENSGGGESRAKKAVEAGTNLDITNPGDIFVMYPNGYTTEGLALDEKELAACIKDYSELNLENDFRDFSDWESGMIQHQVDSIAASAKDVIGSSAKILQIAADGAKALYDYASYAVGRFYDKNKTMYNGDPVKGIVINPYLIGHPAYEIANGYLPIMLWQGNTDGNKIVNELVRVIGKGAVEKYFPNINFNNLNFWIDYTNNFGGDFQAQEIKQALLESGVSQGKIVENNYLIDEVWDPSNGMDAPAEQIAVDIVEKNSMQPMKDKYAALSALSIEDLIAVAEDCEKIRTVSLPNGPVNESPVVIPNIQQWIGDRGTFRLSSVSRICYDNDALLTTANVLAEDIYNMSRETLSVVKTDKPVTGDIYLTLNCSDSTVGSEGYLMDIGRYIEISANADAGVFYGTRTLTQILKQDENHLSVPRGFIKDFPKYKSRGFMLDVARKYFTPRYLENYIRQMSWLKLNEFHIHFTDDQGFRLQSEIYPKLSFEEGYSKQYIRELQDIAKKYHVSIIPEIDLPGHASAIVNAYPETGHALGTALNSLKPGLRPVDLSKDATYAITQGLLDEWVPLFDASDFHIGADEYPGYGGGEGLNNLLKAYPELLTKAQQMGLQTEADLYYNFINWMGDYVEATYGKKARFWEWPERFKPYTSIELENDMIFDAWEGPEAINRSAQGFDIINSNWKSTYIVPGTNMYPDLKILYEKWQPYWLDLTGSIKLAADDPHLLGAKFHNWNDYAGAYNEGGLDRFTLLPLMVFSEDIWGAPRRAAYDIFKEDVKRIGNAPGHGVDVVGAWKFEEPSGNKAIDTSGYLKSATIVGPVRTDAGKYGKALIFDGNDDYIKINEPDIKDSWTVSLWINRTKSATGSTILMDSDKASIMLEQVDTGKVGLTDKLNLQTYSFNYTVPENQWVNLAIKSNGAEVALYVNGILTDTIAASLSCPMNTIGSSTFSINGILDEVKVYARELNNDAIVSVQNGMLLNMPFEDNDQTVVRDESGLLYNGVIKTPTQRIDSGKQGKGLELSNRNSEVVLCHDDVSGPWTSSIWIKKKSGSLGGPLLRSNFTAISITQNNKPKLTIHGVQDYTFNTIIDDGVWTNLTFTSDGISKTALYVNGVYKETLNNTINLPMMTLGYWWQAFDGRVDELKVFDRELSSREISEMVGYAPTLESLTNATVELTWNTVEGAIGYNVYRSDTSNSSYVKLNENLITSLSYADKTVSENSTYKYAISIVKDSGETPLSQSISVAVPTEYLISEGKTPTAEATSGSNVPGLAIDSSATTYWDGGSAPKWWKLDLHEKHDITKINITNYYDDSRYYNYIIETSNDNISWTKIAEKTDTNLATEKGETYIVDTSARYLRVTMTYGSAGNYVHIRDFKVYGKEPAQNNIAANKPVEVSNGAGSAYKLNDSDPNTFWDGGATPAWAIVDLQDTYNISDILLKNYYGVLGNRYYNYTIEASNDKLNWTTVAEKSNTEISTEYGDSHVVNNITARYIKVTVTYNNSSWGSFAHISDIKVYGNLTVR